jgi:protein O-GlcNAc transferase
VSLTEGVNLIKEKKFVEAFNYFNNFLLSEVAQYDNSEALFYKAVCLTELRIFDEAIKIFKDLKLKNPKVTYLHGSLIDHMLKCCDWSFYESDFEKLLENLKKDHKIISTFSSLMLFNSEALQLQIAKLWSREKYKLLNPEKIKPYEIKQRRIKVGYFSSYFKLHPVAILMAEMFELHDKNQFEIFIFSYGEQKNDSMTKRIKKSGVHFTDVSEKTDLEIALLARLCGIDIAIDLNGLGTDNRNLIFSHRAAPVQINYMYAGTLGTEYIDYLIADEVVIPEKSKEFYSEKILYLPNCYMVRDSSITIANLNLNRTDFNLPKNAFVFCCFNQTRKINPETFDSWMTILKAVDNSVLWLLSEDEVTNNNLKLQAKKRNVDEQRIVFTKKREYSNYLFLYRLADLFLDTLPYNAHTTVGDALWAELPVLTCCGTTYAGRVAASHLKAIHLPELITYSRDEFQNLAVELATNPEKLKAIKEKLIENKKTAPLFDTKLFVKNFEDKLKQLI